MSFVMASLVTTIGVLYKDTFTIEIVKHIFIMMSDTAFCIGSSLLIFGILFKDIVKT